jgi:hypothetical protein
MLRPVVPVAIFFLLNHQTYGPENKKVGKGPLSNKQSAMVIETAITS